MFNGTPTQNFPAETVPLSTVSQVIRTNKHTIINRKFLHTKNNRYSHLLSRRWTEPPYDKVIG